MSRNGAVWHPLDLVVVAKIWTGEADQMAEPVGFIGLGSMGGPIAANLLKAGFGVRTYNRTASKADALVKEGAQLVTSPADVAQRAGIVLTMLSDDRAEEELCLQESSFVKRLGPDGIHVAISTISPDTARRLAKHHAEHHVHYVASPVFGRPEAAASKRLWVCTSGSAEPKKRVQPVLAAISQGIFDFGEDAGSANVVKLCGNFLVASAIEALAEALTLARKNGVKPDDVAEMFGKSLFAIPVYQGYGKQIAERRFDPPGFRLALGLKDLKLVHQTALSSNTPMPLASLLQDRWLSAAAKGRGNPDWSAAALGVAEDAGLK
jgi:3-hydroxyisobutyrate dehydrogenase-like beta-hydroxyacid dehydrogenase